MLGWTFASVRNCCWLKLSLFSSSVRSCTVSTYGHDYDSVRRCKDTSGLLRLHSASPLTRAGPSFLLLLLFSSHCHCSPMPGCWIGTDRRLSDSQLQKVPKHSCLCLFCQTPWLFIFSLLSKNSTVLGIALNVSVAFSWWHTWWRSHCWWSCWVLGLSKAPFSVTTDSLTRMAVAE